VTGRRKTSRKSTSPTMVEVAEAAKVSIFTVSAVVNGTSYVSYTLRARTESAIREIGYKRNGVARSLRLGRTKTVGVSVGDITNSFYTEVVSIIQRVLHQAGYATMLCCNDSDSTIQEEQVALMLDRMVDGLIISPTGNDKALRKVISQVDIPVVLIDRILSGVESDFVVLENKAAIREAARYLIKLGHRRIGFISGMVNIFRGESVWPAITQLSMKRGCSPMIHSSSWGASRTTVRARRRSSSLRDRRRRPLFWLSTTRRFLAS
jgi:LacI family transcriptional regulator